MNTEILAYCFVIFCFAGIAALPFIQKSVVRARWAKFSMCLSGVIGIINAGISFMLYTGWLVVDSHVNHVIHSSQSFSGGLFLGIIFTLMFSGQLSGIKPDDQEI